MVLIDETKFFGPGRLELLEHIAETVSKAATAMGLSYKKGMGNGALPPKYSGTFYQWRSSDAFGAKLTDLANFTQVSHKVKDRDGKEHEFSEVAFDRYFSLVWKKSNGYD